MKGLCRIALAVLFVAACGRDSAITGPTDLLAPNAPSSGGGILAVGVDSTTGASIETNKDDYAPGEVVHLVGRGWAAGETVNLHMTEAPNTHADVDTNIVADVSGGFSLHFYDVQEHDLGVTFTLTATGLTSSSRAVAVFTDGRAISTATINTLLAVTVAPSVNLNFRVIGSLTGNSNNTLGAIGVSTYVDGTNANTAVPLGCHNVNPNQGPSTPSDPIPFDHSFVLPAPGTAAVYDVIVTSYSDDACLVNAGSASLTLQNAITVQNPNTAPTLTGVPTIAQSIPELVLYSFDANANDTDVPAQTLTFSIVGTLPTGATFNTGTGVFEWTPTEAQGPSGPHTFTVRVSDGIANTDQLVTLNVTEVNVAPLLLGVPVSATINELAPYTFDANATDSDVPVQTLTFSLNAHPASSAIDPSTGVFTWTPSEAQGPGVYTFDVRVGDGVTTTTQQITLTVSEANASPVITGVPESATIPEMVAYSFDANATDADHPPQTLTFSLVGEPGGATIDGSTGVFNWTPSEAQGPGSYTFIVRVTDGVDQTDASITLTVTEVNRAPVLAAIGDKTVNELALLSFTATANDPDVPANTLTFSLVGAPAGAVITPGGAFTFTPTEAQGPGDFTFTVRVTDNGSPNLADEEEITVHVDEVNAAPVLAAIGNKLVDELDLLTFDANAADSDIPANSLTYSLDAGAPVGASIDPTTGVFTWTPTEEQGPNSYSVTVRVTDNGSPALSDAETITIQVREVNIAPVLAPIGDKSGNELTLITFDANASDADLPANTLTYTLQGTVPAGASINATSGVFTWTPTEAQGPNTYSVTVRATDNGAPTLHDDETITITVNEVNVAPVLEAIGNKSVDEGSELTFDANASDADIPANNLTFSLDAGAPAGASIHPTTGVFTWTPTNGPAQSQNITIRVTDNGTGALSDYETIAVTVNNVAPVIGTISFVSTPIAVGTNNVTVTWNFTDPGTETWTCSVEWDALAGFTAASYVSPKSCNATATLPAGIYTTRVKVADDVGNDIDEVSAYIVVYDPTGGFVTGGGWINSSAGYYRLNPTAEGKANFGFVSKYVPGKTVPTGNTEFQFNAGSLNFKSTVYEWLVVAGTKAMYKGEGTIAGQTGVYGFLLSAIDGSTDKFRIKIWEKTTGNVVYDTLPVGAEDDADPTTPLGGGSIVVHTKK